MSCQVWMFYKTVKQFAHLGIIKILELLYFCLGRITIILLMLCQAWNLLLHMQEKIANHCAIKNWSNSFTYVFFYYIAWNQSIFKRSPNGGTPPLPHHPRDFWLKVLPSTFFWPIVQATWRPSTSSRIFFNSNEKQNVSQYQKDVQLPLIIFAIFFILWIIKNAPVLMPAGWVSSSVLA